MTEPAIWTDQVTRVFTEARRLRRGERKSTTALRGVSLEVPRGELFGLLGPNGAGKTTMVRILTTLLLPTSGSVRIDGHDAVRQPEAVRPLIGFAFGGDKGLYDRLDARQNLAFFAELYRLDRRAYRRRIEEVLEIVDLRDRGDDKVEGFSRGMKQRLHIARSLLHDPPVLFLDEPTNGLDPVASLRLRQTITTLKGAGKTILLTTHYMFEAEELCDRLAIINHGAVISEGTPQSVVSGSDLGPVVRVEARGVNDDVRAALLATPGVGDVSHDVLRDRDLVVVRASGPAPIEAQVGGVLKTCGIDVLHLSSSAPTLEDAYVALIGAASS